MFGPKKFDVSTDRSLVDVGYRLLDAAMILASTAVATSHTDAHYLENLLVVGATTVLMHLVAVEVTGLYRSWRGARLWPELRCVAITWGCTAAAVLGIGLFTQFNARFSYQSKVVWLAVTPATIVAGRVVLRLLLTELRRRGFNARRYAICGMNELGVELAQRINRSPALGMRFVGFFDDRPASRSDAKPAAKPRLLGTLSELVAAAKTGDVDIIFITFPMRAEERIRNYLGELSDATASVYIVPDFFVFQMLHARWNQVDGLPIVSVFESPISGIDGVLKRGFDIAGSLLLLTLLAIPMSAIALLVKLSSPGPVFYRQKRYGLSGEEIYVWKFRSMRICEEDAQIQQARRDDPRITSVGEVLRQTSLDELPQLFNVLGGSMSLVGPRPHASAHNEQYRTLIDGYMLRHKVKPGITGLAQVNGWRGETETLEKMERRIEFDHRYIREWSLWMDVKILFRTAAVVWKQENAY